MTWQCSAHGPEVTCWHCPITESPEVSLVLVFLASPAVLSVFSPVCMVAANPFLPTLNPFCSVGKPNNQGTEPWTGNQELCALNPVLPLTYYGVLGQTFSSSGFNVPTQKTRAWVNSSSAGPFMSNILRSQGGVQPLG